MAKLLRLFSVLAFVVAMFIMGTQANDCIPNLMDLVNECKQYAMPPDEPTIPPSAACCSEVKKVDIPCVCSMVTRDIENLVSMKKIVYVAGQCGRPVKPGFKCGSYTVPNN